MSMKIDGYSKTIALAATPENLVADSGDKPLYAKSVRIACPASNASDLMIGSVSRQQFTIPKGTSIDLEQINRAGQAGKFSLKDIWVKAGTNGDAVQVLVSDPSAD
jgi:hypothetical protein